mmetsp:Transcript_76265/g.218008  ORF Transcript_76265/g.218008 Transcript_76265/m.218008 type:complete len:453 (-) Transcript_76265:1396-2754(-)
MLDGLKLNAVTLSPALIRPQVLFEDVARAVTRIRQGVRKTGLSKSYWLSEICGCEVYLKHELRQFTGSFKERGARNALECLSEEQSKVGVIAASAGNHALALAWHGKQMGIPVTVLMPTLAPLAKVSRCRAFGANVVIHGANIGEAKLLAETDPEFAGLQYINGYDDPEIVAGAGTMGLEILEQLPEADFVIIPCGGAGLLAGSALAIKTLKPTCHVIGVEPKRCASFLAALEAGEPVAAPTTPTLADGLAVPTVGGNAFLVAREYADDIEQVGEHEIALAMLRLIESEKLVVEGGGAAGLAAILPGGPLHHKVQGKRVVVPLCGGNIDTTTLGRVIDRGLAADERLVRFVAQVSDQPGGIAGLTKLLADEGGSIKDIYHERAWLQTSISNVQAKVILETTGKEHADRIKDKLEEKYAICWQPTTALDNEDPIDVYSHESEPAQPKVSACLP